MRILIYGAGAIGCYIGGRMANIGHTVTLILRQTAAELINSDGLILHEGKERLRTQPAAVTSLRQALLDGAEYDVVFLCMKSYDIDKTMDEIAAFYPNIPLMITMQNGVGTEEKLIEEYGAERVIAGTITTPISVAGSNSYTIERSDRGIGLSPTLRKGQDVRPWVKLLKQAGIKTMQEKDYRSLKWSKMILNLLGNSTSAILNRHPRTLYKHAITYNLEIDMVEEALAVMEKSRIKVIDLPGTPAAKLAFSVEKLPRNLYKPLLARIIGEARGEKMPSFQIDLSRGKNRNEVIYHNGAVARQGLEVGVPTPVNTTLTDILLKLVRKEADWQKYNGKPEALIREIEAYKKELRAQGHQLVTDQT